MKISDIDIENKRNWLKSTDFENWFNVVLKDDKFFYNLNSTIYFKFDADLLSTYTPSMDLHWPIISYNIYGTTKLVWLLHKLNNVDLQNTFKIVLAGTQIKYIPKTQVANILTLIKEDK